MSDPDVHRSLGVELNNSTWDVLDAGTVDHSSPLPVREELLYGAYASAYHWLQVGTPVNQARAEHLIARTALQVGSFEVGLGHARRCLELVEDHAADCEDWDLAFAHEAMARALAAVGRIDEARTHLGRFREVTAAVGDPGDRQVLERQLGTGDWFRLLDQDAPGSATGQ